MFDCFSRFLQCCVNVREGWEGRLHTGGFDDGPVIGSRASSVGDGKRGEARREYPKRAIGGGRTVPTSPTWPDALA